MLGSSPPPLLTVLPSLTQVAFALGRLHSSGWVHLGIRPQAIFTSRPVKISDLSYAAKIGEKPTHTFHHAGYSAPEIIDGSATNFPPLIVVVSRLCTRARSPRRGSLGLDGSPAG